jgi:hypothetical protein
MKTEPGKLAGRPPMMVLTGSKAPAEPPITMMSRCGNRCLLSFELRGNRKLYGWFEERLRLEEG